MHGRRHYVITVHRRERGEHAKNAEKYRKHHPVKSGRLWQRLYSVVDVNVETHCMRLFLSTFSIRTAVSRRMQCVSTKTLKFLYNQGVEWTTA